MTRQKEREMTFKFCLGKAGGGGEGEAPLPSRLPSCPTPARMYLRAKKIKEAKGGGEKSNHSIEAHYSEG